MVPGRLQSLVEMAYEFVAGILRDTTGKEGMRFFPLVFTLFIFILMGNMLGLIPGAFTFTSHIIVTFAMAIDVFVLRHGDRLLVPRHRISALLHAIGRAEGDAAAPGADRDPVLLRPADQPLRPVCSST